MHYHIDKTAAQSAYLQLYHQLRRDIVSGVYPLGTKLPSKRLIAGETGVSVITVEHALAILCDEGYLESRERSGFFVSFAAADCFPVSEMENDRRALSLHGTEDEFPFPSLAKTMRRVLSEYGESILVKSPNNGCAGLRGAIAAYLSRSRGISVQPGQIVIGSGAEYLYGLIVQLLGRERVFALEDPSYDKIRRVYQAQGVRCEMLRLGSDGIRSDELSRATATVLHVTPFHSFPSLVTASAGKRREYLCWAEERGGYIVEDDFDSEFSVSSKSEDTLFSLEPNRSVIYMNTFSKTIAPSIRISYMVLPHRLLAAFREKLGFYASTVSGFEQYTLARFMAEGYYEKHLNRMRKRYHQKRDAVIACIRGGPLAERARITEEDAGLHFLMTLDTTLPDGVLRRRAAQRGVRLAMLSEYYNDPDDAPPHVLVVNYSGIDIEKLPRALTRLAEIGEEQDHA